MKKTFAFSFMLILIATFQSYAQSGSYNINPVTKAVTNWEAKFTFGSFWIYDNDLKENRTKTYQVRCIVAVNIQNDGTGRVVYSYDNGPKNVYNITKCIKYDDHFEFTWKPLQSDELKLILFVKNNVVTQFQSRGSDNVYIIFD